MGRPAPLASAPQSCPFSAKLLAEPTSPCDMGVHTDGRWDSQAGVNGGVSFSEPYMSPQHPGWSTDLASPAVWSFPISPFQ